MGAWGTGPFDDDTALDWCDKLGDLPAAERASFVRAALLAVLDSTDDYLSAAPALRGVAAAAVVAAQTPEGSYLVSTTSYAPAFLADGGVPVSAGLVDLARRALDRVISDHSEWRDLWSRSERGAAAFTQLHAVRALLVPAPAPDVVDSAQERLW